MPGPTQPSREASLQEREGERKRTSRGGLGFILFISISNALHKIDVQNMSS